MDLSILTKEERAIYNKFNKLLPDHRCKLDEFMMYAEILKKLKGSGNETEESV